MCGKVTKLHAPDSNFEVDKSCSILRQFADATVKYAFYKKCVRWKESIQKGYFPKNEEMFYLFPRL